MADHLPLDHGPGRSSPGEISFSGRVDKVIYTNEDTLYTVAVLAADQGLTTIVGPLGRLVPGEELTVWGRSKNHPMYGEQIQVDRFRIEEPTTRDGIEAYLGSGLIKGLGPVTAKRLVAVFGEQTLEIIHQHPDRLLEVPKIGRKTRDKIVAAAAELKEVENLIVFLRGHDLPAHLAAKLKARYGQAALARVREDPYVLAREVSGIGFKRADELAIKIGLDHLSPQRMAAGLRHVLLSEAENGHLYVEYRPLIAAAAEVLEVDAEPVVRALAGLMERREVRVEDLNSDLDDFRPDHKAVYLPGLHAAETGVADHVSSLLAAGGGVAEKRATRMVDRVAGELGLSLARGQRRALVGCLVSPVTVITGGPGTGKTTIVRALVRLMDELEISCALAAPTGRAAQRMKEATGRGAATIHRLLAYNPRSGFGHHAGNRLGFGAVIVDEASMIDIGLMYRLTDALAENSRLVLVGDVDQLPPVGPGQALADMIESGRAAVFRLTDVFRQAAESTIITNAHLIRRGRPPILENRPDFYFIPQVDPLRAARTIVEAASRRMPDRFDLDPFTDIQVLSPMRRGSCGVESLNLELQQALNPSGDWLAGDRFRVGDKVIQTRNNYNKMVFNGDVGRVLGRGEGGAVTVELDGRPVIYQANELDELSLAYCLSIHKSQGSEYPAVIIPVLREHRIMLVRNLIYTGLTRARSLALIIGDPGLLEWAVGRSGRIRRRSLLDRRLREGGSC